ncbi:hypothetical protein CYMTET_11373 [Cymbomonas tetramitiformis]|uniref:Uncharacterized protein n=1 Tax=Cymbomonas tetramitiformis TaxID=36881 RepID=A0AAE0LD25_9CHLO|nr:hypothetical protein CYMTET_11373 [Cymbomonas tetramitiformis]
MAIVLDDEETFADMLQYQSFILSMGLFVWYAWQVQVGHCGWEVIYIAIVETFKYIFELWFEYDSPCTVYQTNGQSIAWLRYAEWLSTCPVILIALSRVGTVEGKYSKSTMKLLTSDQGTLVMGVTAAAATDGAKIGFFLVGFVYGANTFYTAAGVYLEAWKNVPEQCKSTIKAMAYIFYVSWCMFPILFVLGPEGAGHISGEGSTIGHCIADLLSKNLWGIFEWNLDTTLLRLNEEAEDDEEDEDEEGAEEEDDEAKKTEAVDVKAEEDPKAAVAAAPAVDVKEVLVAPVKEATVVIVDPTGMAASFFEMELDKLDCQSIAVQSVEGAISTVADAQGQQGKAVSFILAPPNCVFHEMLLHVKNSMSVPLVIYCDQTTPAEMLTNADDKVELPTGGVPFNSMELARIVKKARSGWTGGADVSNQQLFDQMKMMQTQHYGNLGGMNMAGGNGMMNAQMGGGMMNTGQMGGGMMNAPMSPTQMAMGGGAMNAQMAYNPQMANMMMSNGSMPAANLSPQNSLG